MMILRDLLRIDGLTLQQAKVAELFFFGSGYKEIGQKIKITEKSVASHIQNVYWSLDLHSQDELRVYCKNRLYNQITKEN